MLDQESEADTQKRLQAKLAKKEEVRLLQLDADKEGMLLEDNRRRELELANYQAAEV